jgi:hypothetical protein
MTPELSKRIVELYSLGADMDEIAFDTGAVKGDIRAVITKATADSMEYARKRMQRTQRTLYAMHCENRAARA